MVQNILFTEEETNAILSLAGDFDQAGVYRGDKPKIDKNIRNSTKHDFKDNSIFKKIILPKVKKFGIVDIANEAMILRYDEGHFFKRHADRLTQHGERRKNIIIQLSNKNDYEGGELIIDKTVVSKEIGNTVIFDCGILHEVKLLTSGTRYCFVAHLQKSDLEVKNTLI